jgi:hypothetical protein
MDLTCLLQGTPGRLLLWTPVAPPSPLQPPASRQASPDTGMMQGSLAPLAISAFTVMKPPPAEPPPSALLPLMDLTLSPSPVTPAGLLLHMLVHDGPETHPYLFGLFKDSWDTTAPVLLPDSLQGPRSFGSVHRVLSCPRVLGFQGGGRSYARINVTAMAPLITPGHLIDGGANICITGDMDSLFDVVAIPPLLISVAVEGKSSLDDCCTVRGTTPLQLDDGSIY